MQKINGPFIAPFRHSSGRSGHPPLGSAGALDRNPYPLATPVMVKQGDVVARGGGWGDSVNVTPSLCQPKAAFPSFRKTSSLDPRGL